MYLKNQSELIVAPSCSLKMILIKWPGIVRTAYSQITLETNDRKKPPPLTNCNLITVFLLLAQANNTHIALFNEARLSGHRGGPCAGCKWKKRRLSFATGTRGSLETKIQTVLRCPI